ncbi:YhjD/YihY/BrkB family envelope integrity protein [Kineococcus sp. NUM-3379]
MSPPGAQRARAPRWPAAARALLDRVRRRTRSHDMALLTAGVTFYAATALVPSLVVVVRLLTAVVGPERVQALGAAVAAALPDAQGAGGVLSAFLDSTATASWVAVAVALLPATVYGEGLRRGFARVGSTAPEGLPPLPGRAGAWRVRLTALPLLLLAPAGLLAVLALGPFLADRFATGDLGDGALAVWAALTVDWLVVSPALAYLYRVLGPARPSWRSTLLAAYGTGAFFSGFVQGFVVFLAIPVDLGAPFGGFTEVGAAVAVCLWLWLFTVLTVYGYVLALVLDERG